MPRRSYLTRTLRATVMLGVVMVLTTVTATPRAQQIDVLKSPTCDCCEAWIAHLSGAGFQTRPRDMASGQLASIKEQVGLSRELRACHTAFVDGYVIEGHVPAEDIKRLLAERPDAKGLAVPGMPAGSPGMEQGESKEPYDVLLVKRDGSTEIFARH